MENVQQVQVQARNPAMVRGAAGSGLQGLAVLQGGDAFAQIFAQMTAGMIPFIGMGGTGVNPEAILGSSQESEESAVSGGDVLMMQLLAGLFVQNPEAMEWIDSQAAVNTGAMTEAFSALAQPQTGNLPAEAVQFLKNYYGQTSAKGQEGAALLQSAASQEQQQQPAMQVEVLGYQQKESQNPGAQLFQEGKFRQAVQEAQKMLSSADAGKAQEMDVDQLQGQVAANRSQFQPQTESKGFLAPTQEAPVPEQVKDGVAQNLLLGKKEFVIKLKPEGLGEITVKLEEKPGGTVLNLITASSETAKLLNSELNALKDVMRPLQVEVQQAVTRQEAAQEQTGGGNPQNFDQSDFARQFQSGNPSHSSRNNGGFSAYIEENPESLEEVQQVYAGAELDAYI